METLSRKSIESLRIKDIQFVPKGIWDELFDSWWEERMARAELLLLKDNGLEDILKHEIERVLLSASQGETPVVSGSIGLNYDPRPIPYDRSSVVTRSEGGNGGKFPLSPFQRAMVHNACPWFGMMSKTQEYESGKFATVTIEGKYCKPDDLALITYDKALEDGAEIFMMMPKKKRRKGRRRLYECHMCGGLKDDMKIFESVYHRGRYCEDCLKCGACETDPGYDSKWEPLGDFL